MDVWYEPIRSDKTAGWSCIPQFILPEGRCEKESGGLYTGGQRKTKTTNVPERTPVRNGEMVSRSALFSVQGKRESNRRDGAKLSGIQYPASDNAGRRSSAHSGGKGVKKTGDFFVLSQNKANMSKSAKPPCSNDTENPV